MSNLNEKGLEDLNCNEGLEKVGLAAENIVGEQNLAENIIEKSNINMYVDEPLFNLLSDPDVLKEHLEKHVLNDSACYKKYQVLVIENIGLGFIVERQEEIVAVFENRNPYFGKIIGESDINVDTKGGKRVPAYKVVYIEFFGIRNNSYSRSLGKILLYANGTKLENGYEAHHILHSMINTYEAVEKVTIKKNRQVRPELTKISEVIEYIKSDLLKTDDKGFETFMLNLKFLTNYFCKRRGIYVSGINLTEVLLDEDYLDLIRLEVSKL